MTEKSNARATLEFAIMDGLASRAHLTGLTADVAHVAVQDVIQSITCPSLVWAVREYLREIGYNEEAEFA